MYGKTDIKYTTMCFPISAMFLQAAWVYKTGHILYTKSYVFSILISQESVLFVRYRFATEVINVFLSKKSRRAVLSTDTEGVKQPEW